MKTSLVVGGAGGVGLEVARGLAKSGNRVVVTVRDTVEENVVRQAVPTVYHTEIIDLAEVDTALTQLRALATAQFRLDEVVVCAAVAPVGPAELAPLKLFRETFDINLVSHVAVYQACLPRLRERKGTILFMSSMSGKLGIPLLGAYTASKFALEGVADVMRQEAASFGVNVILVEPGGIRTTMVEHQYKMAERDLATLNNEMLEYYSALYRGVISTGRTAFATAGMDPSEVASVVLDILAMNEPMPRYVVGQDAQQLLEARNRLDDRAIDRMLADFITPEKGPG